MRKTSNLRNIQLYFYMFFFFLALYSCQKDKIDHDPPVITKWDYLIDTLSLQSVGTFAIRKTAEDYGYPQFNDYFKYSIRVSKITYKTEYKGSEILASGLICYPSAANDTFPLYVIQNGMLFANDKAPTAFKLPTHFIGYEFIASAGYVVIIPDWIGFGASSDILFPMYNAKYAASATIDMMKAADEFILTKKLHVNDKIFMSGYSKGAFVANAVLKSIEEQNFRQMTATAIGAGGYNLEEIMHYMLEGDSYPLPGQVAMFFASYNYTYDWNRPLTDFFNEPYASKIPDLINGDYDIDEINEELTPNLDSLFNSTFLANLKNGEEIEFIEAFRENSVHDWMPRSRLRLYHSHTDERIHFNDSWNAYMNMKAAGSTSVDFEEIIEGDGHFNAVFNYMELVLPWFEGMK